MDGPVPSQMLALLFPEYQSFVKTCHQDKTCIQMTAAALYVLLRQSQIPNQISSLTSGSKKWQVPFHKKCSGRWCRTWILLFSTLFDLCAQTSICGFIACCSFCLGSALVLCIGLYGWPSMSEI
ncbi:hypothetical protein PoB_001502500 [Plakobranchus ocellatus]|uniref:Uncharacterized protein n=1 Tax=Plakobranchus ocellatus TaxID=259542 RepID=A0AAV3YZC2_9GAST|nr:hypothetical protein PoB_001502500 [Plakobranchus ocellatus]